MQPKRPQAGQWVLTPRYDRSHPPPGPENLGSYLLSSATMLLLGALNATVIGLLGDAASFAGVRIGAVILAALYGAFGFLRMSTSGLAAQAHGAGDGAECSAVLLRALIVVAVAGLGLVALQAALFAGAFALAPASPSVEGWRGRTWQSGSGARLQP